MTSLSRFAPLMAILCLLLGGCSTSRGQFVFTAGPGTPPVPGDIASLEVLPATLTLSKGLSDELEVIATHTDGQRHNVSRLVSWSVDPPSVATVSSESVVTAQAAGTARLIATLEGVSGSSTLTVVDDGDLTSLTVSPTQASVGVAGQQQFQATAGFSNGPDVNVTSLVDWTSSAPHLATVSNASSSAGLAQGRAPGSATISARLGTFTAQAELTITPATLQAITVSPANPTLHPTNTQTFRASGRFSDGTSRDLSSQVTWTSSAPLIATITPSGQVTALTVGDTSITASLQGVSGSTTLTVSAATLLSIDVLPANATLAAGSDLPYQAVGNYDDNSTVDLTGQVTWASSAAGIATVSPAGLVAAVTTGTTNISATLGAVVGSTGLTVQSPTLVSITITPSDNASIATGTTVPYNAMGSFSNGSTADITQSVTWSTNDGLVASVSNGAGTRGQVTGQQNGLVQISASEGNVQATVSARVMLYLYGTAGLDVHGYAIEPTSGALRPVPDPLIFEDTCICQVLVHPTNRFLYALDGDNGAILTADIEGGNGRLVERAGSTPTGPFPVRMAVSPNGDTLYVTDLDGGVFGFTIDDNGTLTPIADQEQAGQYPRELAFDASGRFLYVADASEDTLYGFAVDSTTGALTPLAGSPYPTGESPYGLATSVEGGFVYTLNSAAGDISGFAAAVDGSLSALSGPPLPVGGSPFFLVANPGGRYFYGLDFSDDSVSAVAADPSTGALAAVPGQPFQGDGVLSAGIAIDPSGRFVYTSFLADPVLNGFGVVPASGALVLLSGNPFPVDNPFEDIATTH